MPTNNISSQTISVTDADKLVLQFKAQKRGDLATDKKEAKTFSADKRARLDARLASAFGICLSLLGMDEKEFGRFCVLKGTSAPSKGENPFSACVRILFGTFNGVKVEVDKSAWKYGKAFRAAASLGWTEHDFAEKLGAYSTKALDANGKEKKLGRLNGLEALDSKNHGDPEAQMAGWERKAAMNWLNRVPPMMASIDGFIPGHTSPEAGQMLGVVVQWCALTGKWIVRKVHQENSDKAFDMIAGPVMTEFKAWLSDKRRDEKIAELAKAAPEDIDALLDALTQQNHEVRKAEFEHELAAKIGTGEVTVVKTTSPADSNQVA